MDIVVHDTLALLRPLFVERVRPKELLSRAQEPLFGPHGLQRWMSVPMKEKERGGYAVMQAAQQDGYDVMMAQQMWGLFDPGRKPQASAWAFDRLNSAHTLATTQALLQTYAEALPAPADLPRVECVLVPADPANWNLMMMNHGLSLFGGAPGHLLAEVWPSAGNLVRLKPALARVYAHNLRWASVPSMGAATLADILVVEGLSAAFVAAVCPDIPTAPWLVAFHPAGDWPDALAAVAHMYGVATYDDIGSNVYGSRVSSDGARPPAARPLDADELAYAHDLIGAALGATTPGVIAAYLYGDALVAPQGHPTVGLPPYAGCEVGYRMVRAYLQRTGKSVVEAMSTSSVQILAEAATVA